MSVASPDPPLSKAMSMHTLDCQQGGGPSAERTSDDFGDTVRVYVRVRPPSEREQAAACQSILTVDGATSSVNLRGDQSRSFTFDGVLDQEASQQEAFELVGRSIGTSCLAGFNGSVYVYGQTGVGKTYTMLGPVTSVQSMQFDERRGLICRILDYVFAEIHRRRVKSEDASYVCRCSFLEIYKEQIMDLLEPGNTNLQIREDMNRGVYVERLSEPTVFTLTEAFNFLMKGLQQRHVGATHMNERSSRSHAVFTLSVEAAQTRAGVTSTRVARLSLVDLAGSERQQGVLDGGISVPYQSFRVKEAGAINKSLSALTNVIMSLSREERSRRRSVGADGDSGGRRPFVHYRDSKLTFLLRDSLGGNSETVIVANISPASPCYAETLSTLKFAARAKRIRCAAVRNEAYSGTVESLTLEVKMLRQQLTSLSGCGFAASSVTLPVAASPATKHPRSDGKDTLPEEQDHLWSRKRVRRLEVLLVAAQERERQADQRRHQLQRLAEFLETLDSRKGQHMKKLHKDYVELIGKGLTVARNTEEASELSSKLQNFGSLLGSLAGAPCVPGQPQQQQPQTLPQVCTVDLTTSSIELGAISKEVIPQQGAADTISTVASRRKRGTAQAMQGNQSERGETTGACQESPPQDISVDEAEFLRDENRRLRQQLEQHPEVNRLALENKSLREHLTALGANFGISSRPVSSSFGRQKRIPSDRSPSHSSEDEASRSHSQSEVSMAPVTAQTILRCAEADDDSTLRTWVYFQKMAKEVEELVRASECLAATLEEVRNVQGAAGRDVSDTGGGKDGALGGGMTGGRRSAASLQRVMSKPLLPSSIDAKVVEELVQCTGDALQYAQIIIDDRESMAPLPIGGGSGETCVMQPSSTAPPGPSGGALQTSQRMASSTPQLPMAMAAANEKQGASGGLAGFLARNKGMPRLGLGPLNEQENAPPTSSAREQLSLSVSPRRELGEKAQLNHALQRVKHLHGTLDLVNSAYNDAYDQFQRLREEYEGRVEECHFYELQCSRLDMHCNELLERLHGAGSSVRAGIGSYSTTGLTSAPGASMPAKRSFSLSSLRDVNFWEQRFSQLTGILESPQGEAQPGMPGASSSSGRGVSPRMGFPAQQQQQPLPQQQTQAHPVSLQHQQSHSGLLSARIHDTGAQTARLMPSDSRPLTVWQDGRPGAILIPTLQLGNLNAAAQQASGNQRAGSGGQVAWQGKQPVVTQSPMLAQSSSLQSLRGERHSTGGMSAAARRLSPSSSVGQLQHGAAPLVRRVSSAPLLPSYSEIHAGHGGALVSGRLGSASQQPLRRGSSPPRPYVAPTAAPRRLAASPPPGPRHSAGSDATLVDDTPTQAVDSKAGAEAPKEAPSVAFDPATLMSLSKQAPDKSAALQYLRQSTSQALAATPAAAPAPPLTKVTSSSSTSGSNPALNANTSIAASSSTPASYSACGGGCSSGGSSGTVGGGGVAVAAVAAAVAAAKAAAAAAASVPQGPRLRVAQPPPLSSSGRMSNMRGSEIGGDAATVASSGSSGAVNNVVAAGSPRTVLNTRPAGMVAGARGQPSVSQQRPQSRGTRPPRVVPGNTQASPAPGRGNVAYPPTSARHGD